MVSCLIYWKYLESEVPLEMSPIFFLEIMSTVDFTPYEMLNGIFIQNLMCRLRLLHLFFSTKSVIQTAFLRFVETTKMLKYRTSRIELGIAR